MEATATVKNEKATTTPGKLQLPAYYNAAGINAKIKRAQKLEPEWRLKMIKASPGNEAMAREKGWIPIEDKEYAKRLGFNPEMINASGRVYFMDSTLWRMPMEMVALIRAHIAEKTNLKRRAHMKEFEAEADSIRGRTHGQVDPFAKVSDDILDRK